MPVSILAMCALLGAGVLGTLALSIWGTRRGANRLPVFGQRVVTELVWVLIPCLMVVAAAIPAAIAIIG
jgi:heme/copper-type cytochrome/quinol oxidase subunit 2